VASFPGIEDDDVTLVVTPTKAAISVLTEEDLRRLKSAIFGKWRDETTGDVWEISIAGGGAVAPPAERPEKEIAELERKIDRIRADKIYKWKNTETGEVMRQDRFKRLREPFEYLGQELRRADGTAEIVRLEKRIEELRAAAEPRPVDAYDPVRMKVMLADREVRALNIRVTDRSDYSWTYDIALVSDGRITAKRTLRSVNELNVELPLVIRRKLIASWSPPEWVELEAEVDVETRRVYLIGRIWNMKVTWSPGAFGMGEPTIEGIHTPYSRGLRLERAGFKVAEGAAKDQKP